MGDEREWRRRLPRWLLTVLGYLILLPSLVAELASEPSCSAADPCRDPLGSLTAALDAITFGAVLACLLMLVLVPRLIVWVAGLVAILCGVATEIQLALQPMWVVAGAALLSLGTIDVIGRHHQTTIAAGWSARVDAGLGATAARRDLSTLFRLLPYVLGVATTALAIAFCVPYPAAVSAVSAFEQRAVLTQARVVVEQDELGDDRYTAHVEIEGRSVEVELFEEPMGSTIWVLADPLTSTAVVGGSAAATIWLWQRRRYRLVRHGGPVVRGVLIRDGDRLRLGSADNEAGLDLAILPELESLSSSEPRRALRPGQSAYPVAASELLLRPIGHRLADRVSVEVIGLRSDGNPVMVRVNDEIAVTRSGLRHPDSPARIVQRLRRRRQAAPANSQ